MTLDPQIIALLEQLRALVEGNPQHLSFSISVDPGGKTYSQNTNDSLGNSLSVSQRIANAQ